jgi:hypothetical protein
MQRPSNDTIDIPVLQISDLYDKRRSRDASRLRAYNQLLNQIYHRIKVVSRMPTHPTDVTFVIPPFILGMPRLDLEDCVIYLVYQLRSGGFRVNFTYPNVLDISWKHHEKQYIVNDSPILQAMIATTPQVAAGTDVQHPQVGTGTRRGRKGMAAPASTPGLNVQMIPELAAAPMSAMDWSPPTGFIQAVERPAAFGNAKTDLSRF